MDLQERIKVDEFLDFWQSTLNPVALRLVQNKLMWKVNFVLLLFTLIVLIIVVLPPQSSKPRYY